MVEGLPVPTTPPLVSRAFGAHSFPEEKSLLLAKLNLYTMAFHLNEGKLLRDFNSRLADCHFQIADLALSIAKSHLRLVVALRSLATSETRADSSANGLNVFFPDEVAIDTSSLQSETVKQELESSLFRRASAEILADKSVMKSVVRACGYWLRVASQELRDDPDIVFLAVKTSEEALLFATSRFREDRELVLEVVKRNGLALEFVAPRYKSDKEVVMAAVASEEWALEHAGQTLLADREVVLTALKRQSQYIDFEENIFGFASGVLRGDPELVLEAVNSSILGLAYASPELKEDKDFVLQVFRRTQPEELRKCYFEVAGETVRKAATFEQFKGAADSALACPGEEAPVLTVSVEQGRDKEGGALGLWCTVSLLSGDSFPCHLQFLPKPPPKPLLQPRQHHRIPSEFQLPSPWLRAQPPSHPPPPPPNRPPPPPPNRPPPPLPNGPPPPPPQQAEEYRSPTSLATSASEDAEPSSKRRRVGDRGEGSRPCLESAHQFLPVTMGYLAGFVLDKLLAHRQIPRPAGQLLIFLVLTKADDEGDHMLVTPWDWERPLTDFFPAS